MPPPISLPTLLIPVLPRAERGTVIGKYLSSLLLLGAPITVTEFAGGVVVYLPPLIQEIKFKISILFIL
jgi:hypothetical protein